MMKIRRYLYGKLATRYSKHNKVLELSITRYWGGRLIYLSISKVTIILDCRIDWLKDME